MPVDRIIRIYVQIHQYVHNYIYTGLCAVCVWIPRRSLFFKSLNGKKCGDHVLSVEDQVALREKLPTLGVSGVEFGVARVSFDRDGVDRCRSDMHRACTTMYR